MKISWEHPIISPEELYELLHRTGLLPKHEGNQQMVLALLAASKAARYGLVLNPEGSVLASFLFWPARQHIMAFQWIPELKGLHSRKEELAEVGTELRAVWFRDGVTRVEAQVPTRRRQTVKTLIAMGFHLETSGQGLRGAVDYGRGPEDISVLGLLATDPAPVPPVPTPEMETVNV